MRISGFISIIYLCIHLPKLYHPMFIINITRLQVFKFATRSLPS